MKTSLVKNGAGLVLTLLLTGKIAGGPPRGLSAPSMVLSSGITMVLVYAETPLNLTIAAAGLLHLMSARKVPKMSQIAMLVDAAGERRWKERREFLM